MTFDINRKFTGVSGTPTTTGAIFRLSSGTDSTNWHTQPKFGDSTSPNTTYIPNQGTAHIDIPSHLYWPYPYERYYEPVYVYPPTIIKERVIERDGFKDWLVQESLKNQAEKIKNLEEKVKQLEAAGKKKSKRK